ncbi:MAG: hypothetical protein K5930_13775 [Treponemataceae bacterium]|nr:hypothetical protein [Treponemataceae bacterium]
MKKSFIIAFLIFYSINLFSFPNTEMMNARVGMVSPELQESVFQDPEKNLPDLVSFLIKKAKSSSDKVRIIHDWICNTIAYDAEMYISFRRENQDYVSVLKKQKGLCSGYSSVFVKMCELAKIPVKRIQGICKLSSSYYDRQKSMDHEWNSVKINGSWKLVDCCWDAGYLYSGDFIKRYSIQWLFLPADQFIYSHFPDEEEYQYLTAKKRRTKEQFLNEPFLDSDFFKYGFSLTDPIPAFHNEIDGPVHFTFKQTKKNVDSYFRFYKCYNENITSVKDESEGFIWAERMNSLLECDFDVPDKSLYEVNLFAGTSSDMSYPDLFLSVEFETSILPKAKSLVSDEPIEGKTISQEAYDLFQNAFVRLESINYYCYKEDLFNNERIAAVKKVFKAMEEEFSSVYANVLTFYLEASDLYEGCGTEPLYPSFFPAYNGVPQTFLRSPKILINEEKEEEYRLQRVLTAGETYHFEFSGNDFSNIAFIIDHEWYEFEKNTRKKKFELDFEIPSGIKTLCAYGGKNRFYTALIQWNVVDDQTHE